MSPKEKADELKYKYMSIRWDIGPDDAIQCALIAVDEIVLSHTYGLSIELKAYWEEVKQELRLLYENYNN